MTSRFNWNIIDAMSEINGRMEMGESHDGKFENIERKNKGLTVGNHMLYVNLKKEAIVKKESGINAEE